MDVLVAPPPTHKHTSHTRTHTHTAICILHLHTSRTLLSQATIPSANIADIDIITAWNTAFLAIASDDTIAVYAYSQ